MSSAGVPDRMLRLQNRVVNPLTRAVVERGLGPPTYAVLETIGRRSGKPRRVPVANGLDGDTFWLIAGLGHEAGFVRYRTTTPGRATAGWARAGPSTGSTAYCCASWQATATCSPCASTSTRSSRSDFRGQRTHSGALC